MRIVFEMKVVGKSAEFSMWNGFFFEVRSERVMISLAEQFFVRT